MMESLGMLVQPETIKKMMDDADTDKSGEIDFEEFFTAMKIQAEGQGGGEFAALVNRKESNGPALKWRTDKMGKGVTVDAADERIAQKAGDGWGLQALDMFLKHGPRDLDAYDACDILLQCTQLSGPCYLGLIGSNFSDWEDVEPKGVKPAILMQTETGEVYHKTVHQPLTKKCKVSSGDKFQVELSMKRTEARFTILDESDTIKSTVIVTNLLPAMTFAVGFGPVPDGSPPSQVLLRGTSCEKTKDNEMDVNETVSNEKRAAADASVGAAASLA